MSKNKLAIGVLILLGLIFLGGFGTKFLHKKNDGREDASYDAEGSWMESIDKLMSPFQDPLDMTRLRPRWSERCLIKNRTISLDDEAECEILVRSKKGADAQVAKLFVKEDITVMRPCGEDESEQAQHEHQLEVSYAPAGESIETTGCLAKMPLRLVVLEEGGRLWLKCKGCDKNEQRIATVTLESK